MDSATANTPPNPTPSGKSTASPPPDRPSRPTRHWAAPLITPIRRTGRWVNGVGIEIRRLVAFTLISFVTAFQKWPIATQVIHPLVREQIFRTGVRLVPLVCLLGFILGFIIVGQTLVLLIQHGQIKLFSSIMAPLIIREVAPLAATLIVLMRVGTSMVVELGTARATGEVEALEAIGIDPIHFMVVPRVIGLTVSVFALTLYLMLVLLLGGYMMGFVRGFSLSLNDYFDGVMGALSWVDFPMLGLKTLLLGALNALIICYRGLAEPLRLEQVGEVTSRTVAQCLVGSLAIDVLFLVTYLFV